MLALGETGLREIIKSIGLYKTKAKNILATCKLLIQHHGGKVPQTRDQLEQLPGVGRKTANVILNTAFGEPTIAVDTHIFRVANRTGIAPGKTVLEVELKLLKNVPPSFRHDAHHWLILHGRYICVARKPKCAICIINDLCEYKEKNFEQNRQQLSRRVGIGARSRVRDLRAVRYAGLIEQMSLRNDVLW